MRRMGDPQRALGGLPRRWHAAAMGLPHTNAPKPGGPRPARAFQHRGAHLRVDQTCGARALVRAGQAPRGAGSCGCRGALTACERMSGIAVISNWAEGSAGSSDIEAATCAPSASPPPRARAYAIPHGDEGRPRYGSERWMGRQHPPDPSRAAAAAASVGEAGPFLRAGIVEVGRRWMQGWAEQQVFEAGRLERRLAGRQAAGRPAGRKRKAPSAVGHRALDPPAQQQAAATPEGMCDHQRIHAHCCA